MVWKKVGVNVMFVVMSVFVFYVGFYLINDFVDFLGDKKYNNFQLGYFFVLGFFGVKIFEIVV